MGTRPQPEAYFMEKKMRVLGQRNIDLELHSYFNDDAAGEG